MTNEKVNKWSFFDLISHFCPSSECILCKLEVIQAKVPKQTGTTENPFAENLFAKRPFAKKPIDSHLLCEHCTARLPRLGTSCQVCCMPLTTSQSTCGSCLQQSPFFQRTVAAFHYEPPVDNFITALKFNHQFQFIPLLINDLINKINQSEDGLAKPVLIPVPLHAKKLRKRGFNQALEISKYLAKALDLEVRAKIAKRTKQTSAQSDLDAVARRNNMLGAFQIRSPVPEFCVIVDDVMTTGATANEMAKSLVAAGAQKVHVWCLARAYNVA